MGVSQRIKEGTIVGALVYEAYTPAKCGKVLEDLGPTGSGYFHRLKVRLLKNGEEKIYGSGILNDFEELIADHKRKYERHLATLEKLKAL